VGKVDEKTSAAVTVRTSDAAHVVVEAVDDHRQDRGAETAVDLGLVGLHQAEPEGQEVVGGPVATAARASGVVTDREEALDQPELLKSVEGP